MLSLRSGLLLLGQAKSKSPLGGGEPRQDCENGKPEQTSQNSDRITIPACAGMTAVLGIYNKDCFGSLSPSLAMTDLW
ncbi:hypothetical protein ASE74_23665 [Pedobacter sp. Leaf216]|nr:hypothetical protein ASE74_23665 [Pedobacter sp. Leaf216]